MLIMCVQSKPPLRHVWTRQDDGSWKQDKLAP